MTAVADLLVVGAGPAGLAASLEAGRRGLEVVVVDEQPRAGGQILRQPPETFEASGPGVPSAGARGRGVLAEAAAAAGISWWHETTAWGVFEAAEGDAVVALAVQTADGSQRLLGRSLLVATGAYDLPLAFPGWTLPGVLTAGGLQASTKGQHLLPASRFVLAGSHPLLLVVADQLLAAGAELAEIVFAPPPPAFADALRGLRALARNAGPFGELAGALARVGRARVPLRFGAAVTAAEGDGALEHVRVRVGRDGGERTVACDGLVLGYGFLPSTELARQAGCALAWRAAAGGWVVAHDQLMRTSRPGVFVAGEPAGVTGAVQAAAEGTLAALGAATDLGRRPTADAFRRAHADRRAALRFSAAVQRLFPAPAGGALLGLLTDDTIVCRCEDVTAGTVRSVLADPHVASINSVKLACRTGMGACQGRYCERTVAELTAAARGCSPADAGTFTARAPVKPVPLRALAELPLA